MLRVNSNRTSDLPENNIPAAASQASQAVSSSEACTDAMVSDSIDKDDSSSLPSMHSKLPLQLVDENNACIDLSTGEEKPIRFSSSSSTIIVFIDWSQEQLEKYDTHYLDDLPEVLEYGNVAKKANTEPLSLYTCLEAFLHGDPLDIMWYCLQCGEQRQASQKLDLWRLPEVLVIHLKRFSCSRSMMHKLETFVDFPIHDFDLTNYVAHKNNSRCQIYELYALSNHYGGMGSAIQHISSF
ncbi:hypothetical protein NE237_001038 [Protea cynaroides]|uniref:USP domain-containing protein n=1 Tax=Protea cynaroides TaxID=273540 RepID=A0A9Q0KSJ7_9MAGN|nr:hypothetical protein NE237_001038 [Protea cynaroides]